MRSYVYHIIIRNESHREGGLLEKRDEIPCIGTPCRNILLALSSVSSLAVRYTDCEVALKSLAPGGEVFSPLLVPSVDYTLLHTAVVKWTVWSFGQTRGWPLEQTLCV